MTLPGPSPGHPSDATLFCNARGDADVNVGQSAEVPLIRKEKRTRNSTGTVFPRAPGFASIEMAVAHMDDRHKEIEMEKRAWLSDAVTWDVPSSISQFNPPH